MMPKSTVRKSKVLQLGSPTGLYGAERWILALVRHLDRDKFESSIATIRDEEGLSAPICVEATRLGVEAIAIEAIGRVNFSAVVKLRRLLKQNDIDILHTHGYKTDLIGRLASVGLDCKIVATPHGWSTEAGWKLRLYEWLDRRAFTFFDAVVPLSATLHSELAPLCGMRSRLHLIHNAVDLEEIDAVQEIAPEAMAWKASGEYIVGYIGQLIPRKGLDVLLKAFAGLQIEKKRLIIVGDGPQERELQELSTHLGISDRVNFLGFRSDRIALLKALDVFVLSSRLEGIPRCLMEAMAARIPIVASDIPGCRDIVTDGETGFLYPCDNIAALSERLSDLCDAAKRLTLASKAYDFIQANYSARSMAEKYQDLFAALLSKAI